MTTITFCGHGSIPLPLHSEIRKKLSEVLKTSAKEGAVRFLLGGYGDFDNICAARQCFSAKGNTSAQQVSCG